MGETLVPKYEINKTKSVRISKIYYEWLRKEAFERNTTIRNLTDEIIGKFIRIQEWALFILSPVYEYVYILFMVFYQTYFTQDYGRD